MTRSEAYLILGVPSTATADELKKAYREKAMEHHPDKGGDAEEFKKLNNAYHFLSTGKRSSSSSSSSSSGQGNITPEMEEILKAVAIALALYLLKKHFGHRRYYSSREKKKKRGLLGRLRDKFF